MRVSEINRNDVINFIRQDEVSEEDGKLMDAILEAAKSYVVSYTGLPILQTEGIRNFLDEYEEVSIAVLVLCQDMYDNRSMYVEKGNVNKVVDSILGMHCRNLV